MQVWNMLHAARWKCRTQKIAKKLPSGHHRTLWGYIFATKARIDNRKKVVKQQYLLHVSSQYGELWPTKGWDWLVILEHPSKFQQVSHFGYVTAPTSLNRGQPNFAGCFAISWTGTLYIHFWRLLPPNRILPCEKFTLCRNVAFSYIGSVTAQHSSSVSQTLHRGIFTRQGGHPVRHWEVELFSFVFFILTTGHMHLTASFCRYAVILCNIAVNYVCIAIESARCVCTKTILFIIFVCHWWLGIRKSIRHDPACKKIEWWGAGVVICLEQGSYGWNMVQLMPMPLRCDLLH